MSSLAHKTKSPERKLWTFMFCDAKGGLEPSTGPQDEESTTTLGGASGGRGIEMISEPIVEGIIHESGQIRAL
ncbi:MAG: hypothetical protein ACI83D_000343 [Planctomycetota bacterium]